MSTPYVGDAGIFYWWRGSWQLEKWSNSVCCRVLSL